MTAPAPAPLLVADSRVRSVHLVRSSNTLLWRLEVFREFARTRRANDRIVNLEVYPPRWRFLRWLCRLDTRQSRAIDLPSLQADERSALQKAPLSLPHRSSYYARAVGLSAEAPPMPRVALPPAAFAHAVERTKPLTNGGAAKIVVAHPGSSSETRRAPVPLFATALARVAAEHQVAIIVIGGASEIDVATSLLEALPSRFSAVNWAGKLSLVETAALLGSADLFVGNDSGPLKLAEAMGAPTVSFWGASSPAFAGPRGRRHRFIHFDESATEAATAALSLLGQESPNSR